MKKMRVHILYLGQMGADSNGVVMGDTSATAAEPTAPHRLFPTPSIAVLIDHPEAGWILFDTGMPDHLEQAWPKHILESMFYDKPESASMERQLALVGVKPADIKYVISSHMHMDHIGNDHLFAETAEFFVAKEEMGHAFRTVMQSDDVKARGWYIREEVLLPRKKMTYIDQDETLFPGVEVLALPGHTPCVLGLVLHLEHEVLIFTSDAVYENRNYEYQLPGGVYDSLGYAESVRKVRRLEKKYGAKVFFGHDMGQFSREMKLAPEYYE